MKIRTLFGHRRDYTTGPAVYPDYHLHAEQLAEGAHTHADSRGLRALGNALDVDNAVHTVEQRVTVVDVFVLTGVSVALARMILHDLVLGLRGLTVHEYDGEAGQHFRDFDGDLMTGSIHVHTDADDSVSAQLAADLCRK